MRQALANADNRDWILLASFFQPFHEDSRELELRTTAPPDSGGPNDDSHNVDYQDYDRNEVEPRVNTASSDAGTLSEG
jgi:hypothetical protein